jgi:hypothetical protein
MKTLLFAAFVGIGSMLMYPNKETHEQEKYVQIKANNSNDDSYHEDFDSTYFYNGCKAFTFKFKHICNEKI